MKFNKILIVGLILQVMTGCGGGGGSAAPGTAASGGSNNQTITTVPAVNVMPITVNGSLCAANSYPNKPCVSVTVCTSGTADCQTITDILLDTGSFGLRIFKELLPTGLQQAAGNASLAECVQFGDGSALWGAVQTADIILAGEPAVSAPMQVIDFTFGASALPASCSRARQTPSAAGFNGILGIGLFVQDCGSTCETKVSNGRYYTCNGVTCSGTKVLRSGQVQNPVALLPVDNNGVIVQLPGVPLGGMPAVDGSLVLGIDTQANNASTGATAYAADQSGSFTTTFSGRSYSGSFIDSGSNGLFFSTTLIPNCTGSALGWFCPAPSPVSLFAVNTPLSGVASRVDFQIGNAADLFATANRAFVEIGGTFRGVFDWGLPFFFGRNVYVGFEGRASNVGTGPYWAY